MSFVHLHTHSHYSLLDGLGKIDDLVQKAVEYNMPALALTDHGVMYGAVEFFQKCKKAKVKPIIGVEAYVARNGHRDKRANIDVRPYHLILLAKNEIGYKNIVRLTTLAHLDGFYYKPRIDWELLKLHHGGVICLTACLAGELPSHIIGGDLTAAKEMIGRYQALFGKENFFLEVQYHPELPHQTAVNEAIFALATETGAAVVATNDVHYPNREDDYAQDVLLCIQTKKNLIDKDRMSYLGTDLSFKSPAEMIEAFKDHPEAVANTLKVAAMCDFEMALGRSVLPVFSLPADRTADEQLRFLSEAGLKKHYGGALISMEMKQRLDYELATIQKTGYANYFLIVADFINWAKSHGIIVGPGRGSAAGSFVAYLTGITNLDPIKYDLVFERFLNPERVSMPDIDTDFADTRRDDVIKYVTEKYGQDKVAQIITFGTMAARAAIRDVGRVQSLPYSYCDKVAKMVPMFTDLASAIEKVPELKEVLTVPDGQKLLDTARRLEGVVRHASTHACGVIITPESIDNYGPRQYGSDQNSVVIQYDGHAVEDLGLLKMDFLGLSNLTIIERALEIIEKIHQQKIDLEKIPLNDEKTIKLFRSGQTTGVFQLESAGMKRYLKQLMPTGIEDIIVMVALYRPGPMEYIPDYIAGKHGRQTAYLHPKLKPILEKTYGVAVYQEQLLQIARDLAGFTYGEADILRRAVGKKIKELLDQQAVKMIQGMVKNGVEEKVAKKIWEFILPFAAYGFNRSHAACYAMIAYQTAYLKANYPAEFMAALLTSDQGNAERIAVEVEECRQMGMEVLPPDINESYSTFTVVADSLKTKTPRIRFGLLAVKGLGENIVKAAMRERRAGGLYKNLEDFISRVQDKDLNKRSLEALIKSGCLDTFGERNQLLLNLDRILTYIQENNKNRAIAQESLFNMMPQAAQPVLRLRAVEPAEKRQLLLWEKELLNLYVSEHPFQEWRPRLGHLVTGLAQLKKCAANSSVKVAGVISSVKKIFTKKGDRMVFARVEDGAGSVEILVFPRTLEQNQGLWQEDNLIVCLGKMSDKDDEPKVICEKAAVLTSHNLEETMRFFSDQSVSHYQKLENELPKVYLEVGCPLDYALSQKINAVLAKHPGNYELYLRVKNNDQTAAKIKTSLHVNYSAVLAQDIGVAAAVKISLE